MNINFQPGLVIRPAIALLWNGQARIAQACSSLATAGPSIFSPASIPANSIYHLSLFVPLITAAIFLLVFSLLVYSMVKFRRRSADDGDEPSQVYGSNQVELAWTVLPVLIVVVLFLATARMIHANKDARFLPGTTEVTAVGHQFWWEFQYPQQGFITANELHVPVSAPEHPTPTHKTPTVCRYRPQFLMFTVHGTTMIFFVIVPVLFGFVNYMIPLMIGTRDMAFDGNWDIVGINAPVFFSRRAGLRNPRSPMG